MAALPGARLRASLIPAPSSRASCQRRSRGLQCKPQPDALDVPAALQESGYQQHLRACILIQRSQVEEEEVKYVLNLRT